MHRDQHARKFRAILRVLEMPRCLWTEAELRDLPVDHVEKLAGLASRVAQPHASDPVKTLFRPFTAADYAPSPPEPDWSCR
jgi:hypothetical protein